MSNLTEIRQTLADLGLDAWAAEQAGVITAAERWDVVWAENAEYSARRNADNQRRLAEENAKADAREAEIARKFPASLELFDRLWAAAPPPIISADLWEEIERWQERRAVHNKAISRVLAGPAVYDRDVTNRIEKMRPLEEEPGTNMDVSDDLTFHRE